MSKRALFAIALMLFPCFWCGESDFPTNVGG